MLKQDCLKQHRPLLLREISDKLLKWADLQEKLSMKWTISIKTIWWLISMIHFNRIIKIASSRHFRTKKSNKRYNIIWIRRMTNLMPIILTNFSICQTSQTMVLKLWPRTNSKLLRCHLRTSTANFKIFHPRWGTLSLKTTFLKIRLKMCQTRWCKINISDKFPPLASILQVLPSRPHYLLASISQNPNYSNATSMSLT